MWLTITDKSAGLVRIVHLVGLLLLQLILFLPMIAQESFGGVCWGSAGSSGQCKDPIEAGISKEDCCKSSHATVAWSPHDPTTRQFFQWMIMGGPNTCTPCHTTCENVQCPTDRKCRMKNGHPRCVCAPNCSHHRHRRGNLCGTDGKDYRNYCSLLKSICRNNLGAVEVDYYGTCQRSCTTVSCEPGKHCVTDQNGLPHCIRCQTRCPTPTTGDQVCGSDGVTYASLCLLRRTSCSRDKKVTIAYLGPCLTGQAECSQVQCPLGMTCLRHHNTGSPVCSYCHGHCSTSTHGSQTICGTDNKTYPNWCSLRRTRCRTRVYVETQHNGSCSGK